MPGSGPASRRLRAGRGVRRLRRGRLRLASFPTAIATLVPRAVALFNQRHPDVNLIAFTGSKEVGLWINAEAAKTRAGQQGVKKTICDEIRDCGQAIIIDRIADDPEWRTHPVPMLYGFESYASIPIFLADGSFYGTLCAIDPHPRALSAPATVASMKRLALAVAGILSSSPGLQEGGSAGIG